MDYSLAGVFLALNMTDSHNKNNGLHVKLNNFIKKEKNEIKSND